MYKYMFRILYQWTNSGNFLIIELYVAVNMTYQVLV